MGIGHFGHNAFIHELIRGSLINAVDSWCKRIVLAKPQSTQVEKPENENWEVSWQYQGCQVQQDSLVSYRIDLT